MAGFKAGKRDRGSVDKARAQIAEAALDEAVGLLRRWFGARPMRRADNTNGMRLDADTDAFLAALEKQP